MSSDAACIDRFHAKYEQGIKDLFRHHEVSPFNLLPWIQVALHREGLFARLDGLVRQHTPRRFKIVFGREVVDLDEADALSDHPDCKIRQPDKNFVGIYHGSGRPNSFDDGDLAALFANYFGMTMDSRGAYFRPHSHTLRVRPGDNLEADKLWYKQLRDVECPRTPTLPYALKVPRDVDIRKDELEMLESVWMHITGYINVGVKSGVWSHLPGYKTIVFKQDFLSGNNSYSVCSTFNYIATAFDRADPAKRANKVPSERRCANDNCKSIDPDGDWHRLKNEQKEVVGYLCDPCFTYNKYHDEWPPLVTCIKHMTRMTGECANCNTAIPEGDGSRRFDKDSLTWMCQLCHQYAQNNGISRPVVAGRIPSRPKITGPCDVCHVTVAKFFYNRQDEPGTVCRTCHLQWQNYGKYGKKTGGKPKKNLGPCAGCGDKAAPAYSVWKPTGEQVCARCCANRHYWKKKQKTA